MDPPPGLRRLAMVLLLLPSLASAATLDYRDPVPAGYASPPYYPAPYGGWDDGWDDAYEKAVAMVSKMTIAEKVNITAGTGIYMVRAHIFPKKKKKKKERKEEADAKRKVFVLSILPLLVLYPCPLPFIENHG